MMRYTVLTLAAALLLLGACAHEPNLTTAQAATGAAANRELVLRFHRALDRQEWSVLDTLVAPGYQHHVVSAGGFRTLSWDDFKRGNQHSRTAFPDWSGTPLHVVAEGDIVAVLLIGRGTHSGSIAGEMPYGKQAVLPIAICHQIEDGRIVADWEIANTAPLEKALSAP